MNNINEKALYKLKKDTNRFLIDHGLNSSFLGVLKLVLVVEYWAVLHFRLCEYCQKEAPIIFRVPLRIITAISKPIVEGFTASRLRFGAKIGGGLLLHHSMGVAVAVGAIIGDNCTIFSGVVIAHKADGLGSGAPQIGNNVTLLVGAKIIGNIKIGDNSIVGANAVVLKDIPANSVAVGIPARIIDKC